MVNTSDGKQDQKYSELTAYSLKPHVHAPTKQIQTSEKWKDFSYGQDKLKGFHVSLPSDVWIYHVNNKNKISSRPRQKWELFVVELCLLLIQTSWYTGDLCFFAHGCLGEWDADLQRDSHQHLYRMAGRIQSEDRQEANKKLVYLTHRTMSW